MGKVVGRTDDMFIISGVNIFPSAIEKVLFEMEGVEFYYQIALELTAFEKPVTERLCSALLVRPKVRLIEPGALDGTAGKAKRVVDERPS